MQKVETWTFTVLAFSLSAMLESQEYYHGYPKECGSSDKKRGLIVSQWRPPDEFSSYSLYSANGENNLGTNSTILLLESETVSKYQVFVF